MPVDGQLRRQITRAILLVAGIAAAIGLVIALTAMVALRMAGISGDDAPAPTVAAPDADETPEEPDATPSSTPGSASPTSAPTTSQPAPQPKPKPRPKPKAIELRAGTQDAASMERITLSGEFKGGNGATLQVQRMEGGSWVAFPTTARVEGGRFTTYIALGQSGPNRIRVVDRDSGKASNPVVITIS